MLDVKNLSINYGNHKALDDISININKGEVIGLLGPSGSGKTTFMNVVSGLLAYKNGQVLINELSPCEKTKSYVSLLTENNAIPKWMNLKDIVDFYTEMYNDFNTDKFYSILNNTNLNIPNNKKIKSLSKGTIQIIRVALSISRECGLYLLDEPLGGMDSLVRDQVTDTIINKIDTDSTIVITTHLIAEVEKFLDKVIFIKKGRISGIYDCEDLRIEKSQSIEKTFREVMK